VAGQVGFAPHAQRYGGSRDAPAPLCPINTALNRGGEIKNTEKNENTGEEGERTERTNRKKSDRKERNEIERERKD